MSGLIIEPWPARPRAVSRIQAMPFSAVSIEVEPLVAHGGAEAADLADPSVQSPNSSGWLSTSHCAPWWPPASSSAVKHSTTAARAPAPARPAPDDGQHHRVQVLHVDGAATPHAAVADLARERVDLPVLGRRRYDVEVAVHQQSVAATRGPAPLARPRSPGRARTRRRRLESRPRRAAPRRTPRPSAPPARRRRRSSWCRSGSARCTARRPRRRGRRRSPCCLRIAAMRPPSTSEGAPVDAGTAGPFAIVPAHLSGWRNWQTR